MMQRYVMGLLFNEDGSRITLVNKARPAWQQNKLNGVGGKIEAGESALDAMDRECGEEFGLHGLPWIRFATLNAADQSFQVVCFAAFSERFDTAKAMTDEGPVTGAVRHVLNVDIIPNLRWLIPMAQVLRKNGQPNDVIGIVYRNGEQSWRI